MPERGRRARADQVGLAVVSSLNEMLRASGLSINRLAAKIGHSQSTMSRVMDGSLIVTIRMVVAVADVLGVTVADVLHRAARLTEDEQLAQLLLRVAGSDLRCGAASESWRRYASLPAEKRELVDRLLVALSDGHAHDVD